MEMSGETALPPNFRLNLSLVQKNDRIQDSLIDDLPPIPTEDNTKMASTVKNTRTRPSPVRNSFTLNKRNLVVNHSSDSSDVDLDLDLAQIPIGKDEDNDDKDSPIETPGPVMQVTQLPDLDDDEDEGGGQEKNKLSLLYDLLLTPDQCDEPPDEWTYKNFIKDFAKSEAAENNDDDEYDEDEYEEYDDEYNVD